MRLAADQPGDLGEALFFSRGLGRTRGARDQWPLEVRGGAVQWLVTVRGTRWQYRDETSVNWTDLSCEMLF